MTVSYNGLSHFATDSSKRVSSNSKPNSRTANCSLASLYTSLTTESIYSKSDESILSSYKSASAFYPSYLFYALSNARKSADASSALSETASTSFVSRSYLVITFSMNFTSYLKYSIQKLIVFWLTFSAL